MSSSMYLVFALLSVLHISDVLSADTALSADDIYVGKEQVTRYRAIMRCKEKSMKLVSIESTEKNKQIAELLQNQSINAKTNLWTSGRKLAGDNLWTWLNGDEVTDFSWGPGEPNAAEGDDKCMAVSLKDRKSIWNDRLCDEEQGYICEISSIDDLTDYEEKQIYISSKQFHVSRTKASYFQAMKECQLRSMKLASIADEKENDDLKDLIQKSEGRKFAFWTAGRAYMYDPGWGSRKQKWGWLNQMPIKYFNWEQGEPSGKKDESVCIVAIIKQDELVWNDYECSMKRRFVCENY